MLARRHCALLSAVIAIAIISDLRTTAPIIAIPFIANLILIAAVVAIPIITNFLIAVPIVSSLLSRAIHSGVIRAMGFTYDLPEIETGIVRDFSPTLARSKFRDHLLEAVARGIGQ
jgi:hypothetical protein